MFVLPPANMTERLGGPKTLGNDLPAVHHHFLQHKPLPITQRSDQTPLNRTLSEDLNSRKIAKDTHLADPPLKRQLRIPSPICALRCVFNGSQQM